MLRKKGKEFKENLLYFSINKAGNNLNLQKMECSLSLLKVSKKRNMDITFPFSFL